MKTLLTPADPIKCIWRYRALTLQLAKRDIHQKYRASILGLAWSILLPLATFAVYMVVFTTILRANWTGAGSNGPLALQILAGLTVFNIFSELVSRSPSLVPEVPHLVKKIRFPVEILPVAALGSVLWGSAINLGILFAGALFLGSGLYVTALLAPIILLPVLFVTLGSAWFLAALSVYVPDIRHIVPPALTMLMFLNPVFYPSSSMPPFLANISTVNVLAWAIEALRLLLFDGVVVPFSGFGLAVAVSWVYMWAGFAFFERLKAGFADVI